MKKVAIALMVLGVLVLGLGVAWPFQSSSSEDCLRFLGNASSLLAEASKVEGTPEAAELMNQAEGEHAMADVACDNAEEYRTQGLVISGLGLLMVIVGFVLSRRKAAAG